MPKVNLSGMTVEALMDLRKRVDEMLLKHRAELQRQLEGMVLSGGTRRKDRDRQRLTGDLEARFKHRPNLQVATKFSVAKSIEQYHRETSRFSGYAPLSCSVGIVGRMACGRTSVIRHQPTEQVATSPEASCRNLTAK